MGRPGWVGFRDVGWGHYGKATEWVGKTRLRATCLGFGGLVSSGA